MRTALSPPTANSDLPSRENSTSCCWVDGSVSHFSFTPVGIAGTSSGGSKFGAGRFLPFALALPFGFTFLTIAPSGAAGNSFCSVVPPVNDN